jgi:rhodanese-related sulfurtransferase
VSQDAFNDLVFQKHQLIQFINVSPFAVRIEALPGLIHAPLWKLRKKAKGLNRQMTTILICQHGDILAPKSAKLLTHLGFKDVRVLQGGFFAMKNV